MEFRILGPLEVSDGDRVLAIPRGKQSALLAVLLVHADEVVTIDRLVDELWGESPPATATKIVQNYVGQLRKLLGDDEILLTRGHGYVFQLDGNRRDVDVFEALVADGRRALANGKPAEAVERLRAALAVWRGPALADFAYESFAQADAARLQQLRLVATEELIDAELELGRHAAVVPELEAFVSRHPLRERLRGQLMLALYRSGRQADALAAYQDARRALVEELGIEPGRSLRQLEQAILRHAASLEPAASRDARPTTGRRRIWLLAAPVVTAALLLGAAVAAVATSSDDDVTPLTSIAPDSVAVIDPESNAAVAQISIGGRPAGIATGFGAVWVGNSQRRTLVRIDAKGRKAVSTIGLPVTPSRVAVGTDAVWVASRDDNAVVRVDPTFNTVTKRIAVAHPADLAVGPNDVWIAQGHDLVSRISTRTLVVTAKIRAGSLSGIVVTAGTVWSLSGWSAPLPRILELERLALGSLFRIDPVTNDVGSPVPLPQLGRVSEPNGLTFADDFLWVIKPDGSVFKVAANSGRLEDTGRVGESSATAPSLRTLRPIDIAAGEGAIWVANSAGTVTRIDPATARAVKQIPLGRYPRRAYPEEIAAGEGAVWVLMH